MSRTVYFGGFRRLSRLPAVPLTDDAVLGLEITLNRSVHRVGCVMFKAAYLS